jgi:hypothetical protein
MVVTFALVEMRSVVHEETLRGLSAT